MRELYLNDLTGKVVKEWYDYLRKVNMGCCSMPFAFTDKYRYCVCMGWHNYGDVKPWSDKDEYGADGFRVAWKIGRQTRNNIMQCDLDVDFETPYAPDTGDVDDTLEEVECEKVVHKSYKRGGKTRRPWRWSDPAGYRDWDALAARMRKVARRVYRDWRGHDE